MNMKHPLGVLHSFSIKFFFDKMDLRLFDFHVMNGKEKSPPELST